MVRSGPRQQAGSYSCQAAPEIPVSYQAIREIAVSYQATPEIPVTPPPL